MLSLLIQIPGHQYRTHPYQCQRGDAQCPTQLLQPHIHILRTRLHLQWVQCVGEELGGCAVQVLHIALPEMQHLSHHLRILSACPQHAHLP